MIIVVKYGGAAIEDEKGVRDIASEIVAAQKSGLKIVMVHGGSKKIDAEMNRRGIPIKKIDGLRYTCHDTLDVLDKSCGEINRLVSRAVEESGGKAKELHGAGNELLETCLIDEDKYGLVGRVSLVDSEKIEKLLEEGIIPVFSPVCRGRAGFLNVNADEVAAALACALRANRLIYLSNIPGILMDRGDSSSVVGKIDIPGLEAILASGIIDAGMVPKVRACINVIQEGVKEVMITLADIYSLRDALLPFPQSGTVIRLHI